MEEVKAKLGTLISEKRRQPDNGVSWEDAFLSTFDCLERIGIGNDQISNKLNVIHIAGTKGKGSTSAFCESILRHSGYTTGLFTSPHLVNINERMRLNGKPISDEKFCLYFWQVWNKLEASCTPDQGMPAYFRFLTLMGYYVFLQEKVEAAVIEVGLGGRIDSTNIIKRPLVCGIASLGYDHVALLGPTLGHIAREKAGIFKSGVPAFTVQQEEEAMESLRECAKETEVNLQLSQALSEYALPPGKDKDKNANEIKLGILGDHQQVNAALAVSLVDTFQRKTSEKFGHSAAYSAAVTDGNALSLDCLKGLELCSWPGRGQVEKDNLHDNITFYLDGAHTPESMLCCANWYHGTTSKALEAFESSSKNDSSQDSTTTATGERWLMFNCMKDRDPNILFQPLVSKGQMRFKRTLFVPFLSSTTSLGQLQENDFTWETSLKNIWDRLTTRKTTATTPKVEPSNLPPPPAADSSSSSSVNTMGAALSALRSYAKQNNTKQIHVLVTGSLYLVGDFLKILHRIP